jgi:hypothetical protein
MNKETNIIVYHYPCIDGLASAWCFSYYFETIYKNNNTNDDNNNTNNIIYIGNQPGCKNLTEQLNEEYMKEDIKNSKVTLYFVDICPIKEELSKLVDTFKDFKFVILDHHKTNEALVKEYQSTLSQSIKKNMTVIFNMNLSGCQITWDYLMNGKKRPLFLDYIADRDLWKWELKNSKLINAVIHNHYYSFDGFNKLNKIDIYKDETFLNYLETETIINNYKVKKYKKQANYAKKTYIIIPDSKGNKHYYYGFMDVCSDYEIVSDYANYLTTCELKPPKLFNSLPNYKNDNMSKPDYCIIIKNIDLKTDTYWISIRSNNDLKPSFDTTAISGYFGGGGHKCASGFELTSISNHFKFY